MGWGISIGNWDFLGLVLVQRNLNLGLGFVIMMIELMVWDQNSAIGICDWKLELGITLGIWRLELVIGDSD